MIHAQETRTESEFSQNKIGYLKLGANIKINDETLKVFLWNGQVPHPQCGD